jgi:hypothetical protein
MDNLTNNISGISQIFETNEIVFNPPNNATTITTLSDLELINVTGLSPLRSSVNCDFLKRKKKWKRIGNCRRWRKKKKLSKIWLLPEQWITYLMLTLMIEVTFVNICVICTFLHKKNRSHTTVLLSVLALSDMMSALLRTFPDVYILYKHSDELKRQKDGFYWTMPYPDCIGFAVVSQLFLVAHFLSVLLTTALCVLKAKAIKYPLDSKMSSNKSVLISIVACMVSIGLRIPRIIAKIENIKPKKNGGCYDTDKKRETTVSKVDAYADWIQTACFLLSVALVTISTIYITCKLTCLRKRLPWQDSTITQNRLRRSAIMVIFISIIFVASETTNIILWVCAVVPGKDLSSNAQYQLKRYRPLSLQIGFSLNFIVYITISKGFRDIFRQIMVSIFIRRFR